MFFEDIDNRQVKWTQVGTQVVSTVFLGLDHNFSDEGPPLLFETMILDDRCDDQYQERYSTYEEAEHGHEVAVALAVVRAAAADKSIQAAFARASTPAGGQADG